MVDVVISYKKEEASRVRVIAAKLRGLRVTVWFDVQLTPGENYNTEIAKQLRRSACVLVCWTPEALASDYVVAEAMIGYNRRRLATCLLSETPQLEHTPPFNVIQAADLTSWSGEYDHPGWLLLLTRIGALIHRPWLLEWSTALHANDQNRLAALTAQHPSDPLTLATWDETQALKSQLSAELSKSRVKQISKLATLAVLLAGGGWLAYRAMSGGGAQPVANEARVQGGQRAAVAGEAAASDAREVAASAADMAMQAEAATVAGGTDVEQLMLTAEMARKLCRSPVSLTAKTRAVPGVSADQKLVSVICTNETKVLGAFNPSTGEGQGVLTSPIKLASGALGTYRYAGEFRGFRAGGLGVDTAPESESFEGNFVAGVAHGYGVFRTSSGVTYKGAVSNHRQHGLGVQWLDGGKRELPGLFCEDVHTEGDCQIKLDPRAVDGLP